MPVPPVYGDLSLVIKADPQMMFAMMEQAEVLYGLRVVESINRVVEIWNNLKLGWVGNTADEAKAFNDAWTAAMSKLFGTEKDPEAGILNQIASGVIMASKNYGESELAVVKMFEQMSTGMIASHVAGGLGAHGDPGRSLTDGPITENS